MPSLIDFGDGATPDDSFLTQDSSDERDWSFTNSSTPATLTGPSSDHTTGNGTGFYAFFNSQWDGKGPLLADRVSTIIQELIMCLSGGDGRVVRSLDP